MALLARDDRQMVLLYHPDIELGKQCFATALAANIKVLSINLKKDNISDTEWVEVSKLLNKSLTELINQQHPIFKNIYADAKPSLNQHDAIKILNKHPETLVYPIAIRGNQALQATKTADITKLFSSDSKGFEKKAIKTNNNR